MSYGNLIANGYSYDERRNYTGALRHLCGLMYDGATDPRVVKAARQIVANVPDSDEYGMLQAIFNAVKTGCTRCPPLVNGVRYTRDPPHVDFFTKPGQLLSNCEEGACAEDCDGMSTLAGALAIAVGFTAGLRIVAADANSQWHDHVFTVVRFPRVGPNAKWIAMDTTVPSSVLGWAPPPHPTIPHMTAVPEGL